MDIKTPWLDDLVSSISHIKKNKQLTNSIIIPAKEYEAKYLSNKICYDFFCNQESSCGLCSNCNLIKQDSHPNLYKIMPEKNQITIEQTRLMQEQLYKKISINKVSLVFFYKAELMNLFAANSILKLIEEPRAPVVFIFFTDNINNIIDTIKSRSQIHSFKIPTITELTKWINKNNSNQAVFTENKTKWFLNFLESPMSIMECINNNNQDLIVSCKNLWVECVSNKKVSLDLVEITEKHPDLSINIIYHLASNILIKMIKSNKNTTKHKILINKILILRRNISKGLNSNYYSLLQELIMDL